MTSLIDTIAKALFDDEQDGTSHRRNMNHMLFGQEHVTWEFINDPNRAHPYFAEGYRRQASVAATAFITYRDGAKPMVASVMGPVAPNDAELNNHTQKVDPIWR